MTEFKEPTKHELVTALFECATYVQDLPSRLEGQVITAHVLELIERYMGANNIAYGDPDSISIFKRPGPLERKAKKARLNHPWRIKKRDNHPVCK